MVSTFVDARNLASLYDLPTMAWAAVEERLAAGIAQAPGDGGPDRHTCWLATIDPDGAPHVTGIGAVWHEGTFWFETGRTTRKGRNLARDPRVGILIVYPDDPYRYVEIRGRAQLTPDPENALGNELSHEYLGEDAPEEPDWVRRVAVRVVADRLTGPVAAG